MLLDPDLKPLQSDPRFNAILAKARVRAASTEPAK